MKKSNKGKLFIDILYVVIVVAIIASIIAVSYSMFSYSSNNRKKHTMETGTLIVNLDEGESISLLDRYPISDSLAEKDEDAYTFTVNNTGTETANYRIYIVDDLEAYQEDSCTDSKMPWNKLRYSVTKNNTLIKTAALTNDGVLYTTNLASNNSDDYEIRIWIDSTAGNEVAGLHFHSKLVVKAILENRTDYDTGA